MVGTNSKSGMHAGEKLVPIFWRRGARTSGDQRLYRRLSSDISSPESQCFVDSNSIVGKEMAQRGLKTQREGLQEHASNRKKRRSLAPAMHLRSTPRTTFIIRRAEWGGGVDSSYFVVDEIKNEMGPGGYIQP